MSAHHTWFGRSTATPRKRYGNILCPGAGLVVRGFGPSAAMPMRRISRCTRLRLTLWPSARNSAVRRREPRNGHAAYSSSSRRIGGTRRAIQAGARNAQQRALSADRQLLVLAVDELAAVRGAHLPDLLAKKSRSTMSCPIFA